MSILDTLITNRFAPGKYDWQDFNRITEAMEYVVEKLRQQGYKVPYVPINIRPEAPAGWTVTNLLDYNTFSRNDGGYWGKWNVAGQTDFVNWASYPKPPGGQFCGAFGPNITEGLVEATYQLRANRAVKVHLEPSHKYYFSVHLYQPSVVGSFACYWPIQEPPAVSNFALSQAATWEQHSAIFTRSQFNAGDYDLRFDFDNPQPGAWLNFGNVILVDLTADFGAGKEPSKEWCDEHILLRDSSSTFAADTATITIPGPDPYRWQREDILTYSQMLQMINNLKAIRQAITFPPDTPGAPDTLNRLTYQTANDIEKILQEIDTLIQLITAWQWHAGELYAGEV